MTCGYVDPDDAPAVAEAAGAALVASAAPAVVTAAEEAAAAAAAAWPLLPLFWQDGSPFHTQLAVLLVHLHDLAALTGVSDLAEKRGSWSGHSLPPCLSLHRGTRPRGGTLML